MRNEKHTASARVVALASKKNFEDGADDDMVVEGHKALVPDGWYQARYLGHDTAVLFGKAPKIFLKFEIVDSPVYQGLHLIRPYRVRRLEGKPGPAGRFVPSAGGDLYRTVVKLLGSRERLNRISLRPLRHMLFRVRVRTVVRDRNGNALPDAARYSVIEDIEDGR